MPEHFEGFGISFLYPDSWTLESDPETDSVSLESPGGAFLTISRFGNAAESTAALDRALRAMQEEYDEVEREEVERHFAGLSLKGAILRFVYLDLIVTSQLLVMTHAGHVYLMQIQAEDRDYERLQPVFEAVLTSLCQNLREVD